VRRRAGACSSRGNACRLVTRRAFGCFRSRFLFAYECGKRRSDSSLVSGSLE
jgi:hypothetical protein